MRRRIDCRIGRAGGQSRQSQAMGSFLNIPRGCFRQVPVSIRESGAFTHLLPVRRNLDLIPYRTFGLRRRIQSKQDQPRLTG